MDYPIFASIFAQNCFSRKIVFFGIFAPTWRYHSMCIFIHIKEAPSCHEAMPGFSSTRVRGMTGAKERFIQSGMASSFRENASGLMLA
jgi:hypothetical protein